MSGVAPHIGAWQSGAATPASDIGASQFAIVDTYIEQTNQPNLPLSTFTAEYTGLVFAFEQANQPNLPLATFQAAPGQNVFIVQANQPNLPLTPYAAGDTVFSYTPYTARPATRVQELVTLLRQELHDSGDEPDRRYSDARLLDYLNCAMVDLVTRAPEANVVREAHTIAAGDPPLQTLASDRATKFLKVESNRDSRVELPPSDSPKINAAVTIKNPAPYAGTPEWWQDWAVAAFDDPLQNIFRGYATANGLTYPDVAAPASLPGASPSTLYAIPYMYEMYVEFEARLANPTGGGSFTCFGEVQISDSSANFTHDETPDVNVYWSNSESAPVNNGNYQTWAATGRSLNGNKAAPGNAYDPDWDYVFSLELDENWQYAASATFYVQAPLAGMYDGLLDDSIALTYVRLLLASVDSFGTPNAIEVRNVRLRCPQLERYSYGGAGLGLGYIPPHVSPEDGSPVPNYHFHARVDNTGISVFASQEPGELFPAGAGGSSQYTGVGLGPAGAVLTTSVLGPLFDQSDWDWQTRGGAFSSGGAVPPGEWEGNRAYWPSETGIPLADDFGFDGAIDDLNVSLSHLMASDRQSGVLNMTYAIALEVSEDSGQSWSVAAWLESTGTRSVAAQDIPAFDFTTVSPGTYPGMTHCRLRIDTYMGFPAQADNTPQNDVVLYDPQFRSTSWANRWTAVTPLDPPLTEGNGETGLLRWVEKDVYDTYDPDWYYTPGTVANAQDAGLRNYYTHFSHDPRDPTRFYLFPAPPTEETQVYVHYARIPDPVVDVYEQFPLSEKWEGPTLAYAKFLALTEQGRETYLPEQSRARLFNEYTTMVRLAREAGYSDSMRDDG